MTERWRPHTGLSPSVAVQEVLAGPVASRRRGCHAPRWRRGTGGSERPWKLVGVRAATPTLLCTQVPGAPGSAPRPCPRPCLLTRPLVSSAGPVCLPRPTRTPTATGNPGPQPPSPEQPLWPAAPTATPSRCPPTFLHPHPPQEPHSLPLPRRQTPAICSPEPTVMRGWVPGLRLPPLFGQSPLNPGEPFAHASQPLPLGSN